MMGYGYYGHGMMGFGGGIFMMLLALVLTVLAIAALVRYLKGSKHSCHMDISKNNSAEYTSSALIILNERYAKGEVSEEEYKKKKADIIG